MRARAVDNNSLQRFIPAVDAAQNAAQVGFRQCRISREPCNKSVCHFCNNALCVAVARVVLQCRADVAFVQRRHLRDSRHVDFCRHDKIPLSFS